MQNSFCNKKEIIRYVWLKKKTVERPAIIVKSRMKDCIKENMFKIENFLRLTPIKPLFDRQMNMYHLSRLSGFTCMSPSFMYFHPKHSGLWILRHTWYSIYSENYKITFWRFLNHVNLAQNLFYARKSN